MVNQERRMRSRVTVLVAAGGALIGWSALALQAMLTLAAIHAQGGTWLEGLWRYAGYFTIIANVFASGVLARALFRGPAPRMEFCAMTAMVLVGVVYSLVLRESWKPQGWQKLADVMLHDAMPLIVLLFWLLRPHGGLRWSDVPVTLVLPFGYLGYGLARGGVDGWYAYGFMDVAKSGVGAVAVNCAIIGLAFVLMALLMAALDRLLAHCP